MQLRYRRVLLAAAVDDLLEVVLEPLHVFLSLDAQRAVGLVERQRDAHLGVHLDVVVVAAAVVLWVGGAQRAQPPRRSLAAA